MTQPVVDKTGAKVSIHPMTNIIRVDGVIVCKAIKRDGQTFLQFKDSDDLRCRCRGTCFIEIPVEAFSDAVIKAVGL